MKSIDEELKAALKRVEAPSKFAERVLAQARPQRQAAPGAGEWLRAKLTPGAIRWAVAFGAACVLILAGVRFRQHQQEKIQGMRAAAQARQALQIASGKLNAVFKEAASPARRSLEN